MIVLAAINARYIHSNLAVYSLKAYAEQRSAGSLSKQLPKLESTENLPEQASRKTVQEIWIAEYTINQPVQEIMASLYEMGADIIAFSCYIWNIEYVCQIARNLKRVAPNLQIWLGGPEVSYHGKEFLEQYPFVDLIMLGEGEEVFSKLVKGEAWERIPGIVYRQADQIQVQPPMELVDLNQLPFVYKDMSVFEHRIVYYESSRGCPFRCSYCLSSIDKQVRFRSLELVKEELQFFLDHQVPQVKFIDRTFNCSPDRAQAIWEYILNHDNGVTNFHFEISADLLTEEQLIILKKMRKGLIQFEIGLQTTNPQTLQAIERHMDVEKLKSNMELVHSFGNIHQHLDLIAGLPYEGLERFRQSFDEAYEMGAEQLQLGFLKVLKGSAMEERVQEYHLQYTDTPPYEVLSTKWLNYGELLKLKLVEEMLEVYHNSGQFRFSLIYVLKNWDSPFDFFLQLGEYYKKKGYQGRKWKRLDRYEILRAFCLEEYPEKSGEPEQLERLLLHDLYVRENLKKRPSWAKDCGEAQRKQFATYFRNAGYAGKPVHLEPWVDSDRRGYMLYDYEQTDSFEHVVNFKFISEEEFQMQLT